jgi:hypothetical protein
VFLKLVEHFFFRNNIDDFAGASDLYNNLSKGEIVEIGDDKDFRSNYVQFQRVIETIIINGLECNYIDNVICCIHTKLAPTPLRSEINDRSLILRKLLKNPNCKMICAYHKPSVNNEIEGMDIFKKLCEDHKNLHNVPIKEMKDEMSGATYLITCDKKKYIFSIQATQANDIRKDAKWGVWLGSIELENVKIRFDEVNEYLLTNSIDLMKISELVEKKSKKKTGCFLDN